MIAALLSGCSATSLLNYTSGAAHERTAKDVVYGEHKRQQLDIYRPEQPRCRIVFVYGGNWREGDKAQYGFVGAQLAKRGYEVIIPNYRLYPQVTFPAFVEDIALSIAFIQKNAGANAPPLVLMGHSAGALIAGLLAYEPSFLAAVGVDRQAIEGLISIAGPHDYFLPTDKPRWSVIFGENKQQQVKALPVNHVNANAPPTMILHGADDKLVTPKSAESLARLLARHGVLHKKTVYADIGHRRIIAAIGFPLHFLAPTLEDVSDFLDANVCLTPR